jgi:tartrate/fumarate subfamily iron-sulfur-dependent hydro-lyase beta chain
LKGDKKMATYHLQVPLQDEKIRKLRIGDIVYFTGEAFTTRSKFQRYIFDEGHQVPFPLEGRNLLIHVGPVVVREGGKWRAVSFGPTTSIRFEKWGPKSIKEWRLKCIIGKATMGESTQQAMKEYGCVHVSMIGVTSNLGLSQITIKDVFLKDEMGSIEAPWLVQCTDYGPFLVDIDTNGDNYYDKMDKVVEENRKKAFEYLNIPEDFKYTKLY